MTHPYHLLIIDDSPSDTRLMTEAIRLSGLKELTDMRYAPGGKEGLDLLHAAKNEDVSFSLILLDLNMPKIGGRELLAHIKKDKKLSHVPVFIMTNSDLKSDIEDCYALGADAYIQKPSDFAQLIAFFAAIKYSLEARGEVSTKHISAECRELKVA